MWPGSSQRISSGRRVMSSNQVPLKICLVRERCALNLSGAQTSSPVGVMWRNSIGLRFPLFKDWRCLATNKAATLHFDPRVGMRNGREFETEIISVEFCSPGVPREYVSEKNVALLSYTRAFRDGPRNFELWSSDEDDTLAGIPSPYFPTTPTGGRTSFDTFLAPAPTRWIFSGTSAKTSRILELRATTKLIPKRFVSTSMNKDIIPPCMYRDPGPSLSRGQGPTFELRPRASRSLKTPLGVRVVFTLRICFAQVHHMIHDVLGH
ncbi:hypothetical protein TNCV_1640261 [Trichonephila clavipes]|nr:hypothetical protein TNCV_1640261 [Trichonephila clavipes]